MLNLRFILAITFIALLCIKSAVSATLIKVFDQNNSPLPNAVIEYLPAEPALINNSDESIYVMDQINKSFMPEVLVIPKNSLVSFPNSDNIRHHVYSFSAAKTFELKLYSGKPKSPVRFENEGVVVMGCNIHDSMVGYIYISNQNDVYMTNEKGELLLEQELAPSDQLTLWHPNMKAGINHRELIPFDKLTIKNNEINLVMPVSAPVSKNSFEVLFSDVQ